MSRKNWINRWTYILSDQLRRKGRILRHEDLGVSGQRKKQIQGRCRSESSRHCGCDDGADSDYCRAVFFPVRFLRNFIQYRRGFPGFARMDRDMRKEKEAILQQMRKEHLMPAGAVEIVKVDSMRERSRNYSLVCRVKYGHGGTGRRTYLLAKGYEDERGLLWELERRKSWQPALEMRKDHTSAYILISVLLFAVCTGLCILSHPSVAYLPQTIYFPCLGLDFVFIWILVYLVIKRRRGE